MLKQCFLLCFSMLCMSSVDAGKDVAPEQREKQILWNFSGMAKSENGEQYYYYFSMQVSQEHYHTKAYLLSKSGEVVVRLDEKTQKGGAQVQGQQWKIGHAYINHNTINDSWVFAVKDDSSRGFNFRLESLTPYLHSDRMSSSYNIRYKQPRRMNGHIYLEGQKERFVTADANWFRSVLEVRIPESMSSMETLFCMMDNKDMVFGIRYFASDAFSASSVDWLAANGERKEVSQFFDLESRPMNRMQLKFSVPKRVFDLEVIDTLGESLRVATLQENRLHLGSCILDKVML